MSEQQLDLKMQNASRNVPWKRNGHPLCEDGNEWNDDVTNV